MLTNACTLREQSYANKTSRFREVYQTFIIFNNNFQSSEAIYKGR